MHALILFAQLNLRLPSVVFMWDNLVIPSLTITVNDARVIFLCFGICRYLWTSPRLPLPCSMPLPTKILARSNPSRCSPCPRRKKAGSVMLSSSAHTSFVLVLEHKMSMRMEYEYLSIFHVVMTLLLKVLPFLISRLSVWCLTDG